MGIERRERKRECCKFAFPFEVMWPLDSDTLMWIKGIGQAMNRNLRGMLVVLPAPVKKRQVFEVAVPSDGGNLQSTKLVEVCWTHPIKVDARRKLYLAGTRFLFELPGPA